MSNSVDIPSLIAKKRDGGVFRDSEIRDFVRCVVDRSIADDQLGAMLMAIYLKKMNNEEMRVLTEAMRDSGDILSWPGSEGLVVDKHSTGGVGDKVSLVLAPALAACGMKVPMISGRGLGHTGGTLDKLESIPGYNVSLSKEQIKEMLETVGCVIAGQTAKIAPADKRLYATRDVTATVDDISLITASIICKKAAEGLDALILDVKCGKGAWSICSTEDQACQLAQSLVSVGNSIGIKTVALVTEMDNPIGRMVGNALEVIESIRCLQNRGPDDLTQLVAELGGHLLDTVQPGQNGKKRILSVIQNGEALQTFLKMLVGQGVDSKLAANLCDPEKEPAKLLPKAKFTTDLNSDHAGYISEIHAMTCACVTRDLGAGRMKAGQSINHSVGLEFLVDIGSPIAAGQPWLRVHHDDTLLPLQCQQLQQSLVVSTVQPIRKGRVLRKL